MILHFLMLLLLLLLSLFYKQLSFINETTKPGIMHRVTEHVPTYISPLGDDVSCHRHVRTHWAI
jgi:hypothetical protein